MEGNPVTNIEIDPRLADGFKKLAEKTKHPGAWSETFKKIKTNQEDPRQDLMLLLVDNILTRNRVKIPDNQRVRLADEYDALRNSSGLNPADETIDHEALVTYLLRKKGIIKPLISRRSVLKIGGMASLLGLSALTFGNIAEQKPNSALIPPSPSPDKPTQIPEPTHTPEKKKIFVADELLKPFIESALRKREWRLKNDPEYLQRVDQELNQDRINLLLFGYGEEHGESYSDYGGSISILSLDLKTRQIQSISLSRDIRAPEIENLLPADQRTPKSIRGVYKAGGFGLMRTVAERATGLCIDHQIVLKDVVIRDLVDQITSEYGPLDIEIDKEHHTASYRLGSKEYPPGYIPAGKQKMDTETAMRFILAEDQHPGGKEDERSYRKTILFKAMSEKIKTKAQENKLTFLKFMGKVATLLKTEGDKGNIEPESQDLIKTVLLGLNGLAALSLNIFGEIDTSLPESDPQKQIVIHDKFWGEGSVTRVHNIKNHPDDPLRNDNRSVVDEVTNGNLSKPEVGWILIPDGGNPYAQDLVKDYWFSLRKLVKLRLSGT